MYNFSDSIRDLDLTGVHSKLMKEDGFSEGKAEQAITEYRMFLELIMRNPELELVPNKTMDAAWHHHITDTKRYITDCGRLFGAYLHHDPNVGSKEELAHGFNQTKQLVAQEFGYSLEPDAEAAICGGCVRKSEAAICGGCVRKSEAAICGGCVRKSEAAICGGCVRAFWGRIGAEAQDRIDLSQAAE